MKPTTRPLYIYLLLSLSIVALTVSLFLAYQQTQRLVGAVNWVSHTYKVIELSDEVLKNLLQARIGTQDFLGERQVNDENFVRNSLKNAETQFAQLKKLTADNPSQSKSVQLIAPQLQEEIISLKSVLQTLLRNPHFTLAQYNASINQDRFKSIANQLRLVTNNEKILLQMRTSDLGVNVDLNNLSLLFVGIVGNLLLVMCFFLLTYYLYQRNYAERERENSEQRLKKIIDGSNDFIAALDHEYRYIAVNAAYKKTFAKLLNHNIELGMNLYEVLENYASKETLLSMWRKALAGHEYTVIIELPDHNKTLYFETTFNTMRDNLGNIIGASHIMRDVTERKKVDELKNNFISVVSHELRTPLTSIKGSLGILISGGGGPIEPKAQTMLNIAYSNCERLINLINDILDIEKIDSGKIDLEPVRMDLNALVKESIEANLSFANKYDIKLHYAAPADPIEVIADPARIMQVLTNLISNAVKFSEAQGTVEIAVIKKKNVRVTVTNKGETIPENFQKQIFSKFSQADSSAVRKRGGSGLGLSISKSIIEKLGGTIGFHSKNNVTEFYFELPSINAPSEKVQELLQKKHVEGDLPQILYVEDNLELAEVISSVLHNEAEVISVADQTQARFALSHNKFDLILLDLVLPDGNAVQLLPELQTYKVPIIVFSGHDLPQKYKSLVSSVLIKSKTTNQSLINAVKQALQEKKTVTAK